MFRTQTVSDLAEKNKWKKLNENKNEKQTENESDQSFRWLQVGQISEWAAHQCLDSDFGVWEGIYVTLDILKEWSY